jgi:hypothetical protein
MAKRFRIFKNKYLRLISLIVAAIVIGGSLLWILNPQSASAVWYDDNFGYREKIIIGNTGSADSNKKVKLDIDTATMVSAGKIQSDCDDTRFTDINGKILKYYLDTAGGACNGASTDFYVLLNTINSGETVIYMYHGNPSAVAGTQAAQFAESTFVPTSGPTVGSEEKGTPPILSWKFDEGSGTTTQDSSSNNNDGTTSGPTWRTEDVCISGKCLQFDRNGDYVSRAYSSDAELDVSSSSFSVSVWFKHPNSSGTVDALVSRFSGAGYILYMNTTGNICFGIDDDGSTFPEDGICTTESYYDIKWHFVEAVKSGTSSITLYVDGKQKAQDTSISASGSLSGSSPTLFVGGEGIASNLWDGFIDELRIYNYAKSSAQVLADYNSRAANQSTAITFGSSTADTSLAQNLVGYWKMDETAADSCTGGANDACDSSGNRNDMVITNNVTFTSGKFANAASFDGTDDALGDSISGLTSLKRWTVSSWFKTSDTNAYIFDTRNGDNDGAAVFSDGATTLSFFLTSGGTTYKYLNYTTSALDNNWHHLIATRDNDNSVSLYIDGNKLSVASTTTDVDMSAVSESWSGIVLGRRNNTDIYALSGLLDETRLYTRAFSPIEASTLYDWGPGPTGYWKLDERTGASANDASGNGNTLTLSGSSWGAGKFGGAWSGDGTNRIEQALDDADFDFAASEEFTLSMWFKSDSTSNPASQEYLYSKGGNSNIGYFIRINTSGQLVFGAEYTGDGNIDDSANPPTDYYDNKWHFLSAIKKGTTEMKIYVDGVLVDTDSSITNSTLANSQVLRLGDLNSADNGSEFNGDIDDVKVYRYARTEKQIIQDMNAGNPAVGGVIGSAVGYWPFDEGYSTTANNRGLCGTSCNGTLTSMAAPATSTSGWNNSGKLGKALEFDGSNDYVTVSDTAALDITGPVSVSAWVKKSNTTATTRHIVVKGTRFGGTSNDYALINNGSNQIRFEVSNGGTNYSVTDTTLPINDTNWHHVVGVYIPSTALQVYIDGKLRTSNTSSIPSTTTANSNALRIGINSTDTERWAGTIDEVKVYDHPLSQNEVNLNYNMGSSQVLGSTSTESDGIAGSNSQDREYCIPGDTSSCSAPVAEWKFDERTGTTVNDTSGNDNTGTLTNGPTWAAGKNTPGILFDGSNDYIAVGSQTGVSASAGTVDSWVKPTSSSPASDEMIVMVNRENNRIYLKRAATTGNLSLRLGTTTQVDTSTNIPANSWSHVSMTWNSGTYYAYVNGVQASTGSYSGLSTLDGFSRIGAYDDNAGDTNTYYAGFMDQVRIFGYARSASQIAWDYNKGGPIAHWKFDEGNGTSSYDATGNSVTGTITIGASGTQTDAGTSVSGNSAHAWYNGATGKYNTSLNFDGTDDYVSTANVALLATDTSSYSNLSWGAWIKKTTANDNGNNLIMIKSNEFRIKYDSSGYPYCSIYTGGAWVDRFFDVNLNDTNTWFHLMCTYNGTNIVSYVNGVSGSTSQTGSITSSSSTPVIIGRDSTATNYFAGQIDDVRIYNYALTANQIKTLYNDNSALRFGPSQGQP